MKRKFDKIVKFYSGQKESTTVFHKINSDLTLETTYWHEIRYFFNFFYYIGSFKHYSAFLLKASDDVNAYHIFWSLIDSGGLAPYRDSVVITDMLICGAEITEKAVTSYDYNN